MKITYYHENGEVAGEMEPVGKSKLECLLAAQSYMSQMQDIVSASITDDLTETVIGKTTEWQKRNG